MEASEKRVSNGADADEERFGDGITMADKPGMPCPNRSPLNRSVGFVSAFFDGANLRLIKKVDEKMFFAYRAFRPIKCSCCESVCPGLWVVNHDFYRA
jgi:hypothetical protein